MLNTKKNILYLHGFNTDQKTINEHNSYIRSIGYKCFSPNLNYSESNNKSDLYLMLISYIMNHDIGYIIGFDIGGYIAKHLSQTFGIDALVINESESVDSVFIRCSNKIFYPSIIKKIDEKNIDFEQILQSEVLGLEIKPTI